MRIAIPNRGVAFTYLFAAKDLGFFQAQGLDAQISVLAGQPAVAALQSGEIEFMAGIGSATRAALTGLPFRVVHVASNQPDYLMVGAKGYSSLNDLSGKTLAFYAPDNTVNVVGSEMLTRSGVSPDQYTILNAGDGPSRSAALVAGVAQAALLETSDAIRLQQQGYPVLANAGDLVQIPFSGLAASTSAMTNKHDLIRAGLTAALQGVEAARTQKSQVVPVIMQEFSLAEADASTIWDEMAPLWTADGRPSDSAVQLEFQVDQAALDLSQPPQASQVYDFSLLDEVAQQH